MALAAVQVTIELAEINCGACGGTYAINERYRRHKFEKGGTWNCPYCKAGWGYIESELERARKALEAEKARVQSTLSRLNIAEAEKEQARKKIAKMEKRAKAGVCPCCNRTFVALQRHMKTKHPEYG